jgi:acetoacetyl-CoA synthetase
VQLPAPAPQGRGLKDVDPAMTILWQPSPEQIRRANLTTFRSNVTGRHKVDVESYANLHAWSIEHIPEFWEAVWDFCEVIGDKGETVLEPGVHMLEARFFPGTRLNFAENLLRRRDNSDAVVFRSETGFTSRLSWRALYGQVSRLAQALRDAGLQPGDRIAACLPNCPEAVTGALAAASLGGVWSSCSPDFGEQGMLDRFQQITPRFLIACDGYMYNGKSQNIRTRLSAVAAQIPSLQKIIIVPYLAQVTGAQPADTAVPGAVHWDEFMQGYEIADIEFAPLPFSHPLYILFSSGTTGLPKCIIHGAGGTLLQHLKEHRLHCDIRPEDKVFYFTTCGWMMWNWLVSALGSEATILLYDGSPFHADGHVLFDYAEQEGMTFFGASAKYLQALEKNNLEPGKTHDLAALRTLASTGSPLLPASFDYVYDHIKRDLCLSSISGGTDIISCFVLGNSTGPVIRGEIQAKGLGMAVDVWDEAGHSVIDAKGELVCTRPFPSMPVGFWNDKNNKRYRAAYFERFPGVWAHGDFAAQTASGGFIIYGRSDAVLNPGGVRIGTAEIYRQVEGLDEVLESVAVGREQDGDVRILLFVILREGLTLDDELVARIKQRIRDGASPRHVPAAIYQVPDIPRTRSGKISEIAVRDVIHGRTIKNVEALANPGALEHFRRDFVS